MLHNSIILLMAPLLMTAPAATSSVAIELAARRAFEESFGPQYRKVIASRGTEDDAAMALELVAAAKKTLNDAALLSEICDNAFVLGMRDPAGYDAAAEAVELLTAHLPDKAAAAREKLVIALRRVVSTNRGAVQAAAARRLVEYLAAMGDARVAASDFGGAAKLYLQAVKAAEETKDANLSALTARYEAAAAREKLELRIEATSEKLALNPTDAVAAAELLRIFLIELDDPAQALRYVKVGGDEAAKALLPLVTGRFDGLSPANCMDLGEWYESMLAAASAAARPPLIVRSRAYYEQFLLLSQTEPLQQVKAKLAVARLRDALMKAKPEYAKLLAPVDADGSADLLTGIETGRYRIAGRWRTMAGGVAITAEPDQSARLMLPAAAPDSYELTVKFNRTAGDGAVVVVLPVGPRSVRLVLSGWAGKASGLYTMAQESTHAVTGIRRNDTTVTPGELTNEQDYALRIRTHLKGDDVTFAIDLNEERLIDWTGPIVSLSNDAAWKLPDARAIALGATNASVTFLSAHLRALRGDVVLLPKPTTLVERGVVTVGEGFVDLLEIWDPAKDSLEGQWLRELDAAVLDRDRRVNQPRTRMPVIPDGNYTLRARITCVENRRAGGTVLYLPIKETGVMLSVGTGQRGNLAGLSSIDGKDAASNDSTVKFSPYETGKQYLVEARVIITEDQVRIEADVDGERLVRWEGPIASLKPRDGWIFGDGRSPAVGMWNADFTFDSIEMRMETGEAPLVRKAAAKMATDTTPVDLVKLLDTRKHAMAGTWAVDGGNLTTTTVGFQTANTLMLPIIPEGSYELRARFIRAAGRPVIQVYLPIGETAVDLTLGAAEGRTCSLSAPVIKTDQRNIISNSSLRLVNGLGYSFKARVETSAEETSITVELDGKPYLNWKGPTAELRPSVLMPAQHNSKAPGFVVTNVVGNTAARSGATFTDVQLTMISGASKKIE